MSKLTYTFDNDNGSVSVEWIGCDRFDGRHEYRWSVIYGESSFSGDRIRSGSGDKVDMPEVLSTLLGFLSAFAEARQYGTPQSDNWSLFPDAMAEWATMMSDAFTLADMEVNPEEYS